MAPLSPLMLGCLGIVLLMSNECSTTCVYGPTIRVSGVFILGETKELLCALLAPVSQRDVTFQWSLNGIPLLSDVLPTTTTGNLVTRQIRHSRVVLASDEEQIFNCTAYFNSDLGGDVCFSSYKIQSVYTGPNMPVIIGPSAVQGGGNATWLCYSDGATGTDPSIVWRYGNGSRVNIDLYSQTTNTYNSVSGLESYNVSSQLTLPITSGAPNFALECQAVQTNSAKSSESVLSIMITYPPLVTVAKTNYTGRIQTQVTLLCSVTAAPAVTVVRWNKDGENLDTASARYSGSIPSQPNLTILSLVKSDRGTYVCEAANSVGSGNSAEVHLVVRYRPSVTYADNPVGGVIGSDVTVSCLIDAVPQYSTVLWYRVSSTTGTETLLNPANSPDKYSGGTAQTTPNVTIKNLDTSDQGLYKCGASNDVGSGDGGNVRVEIYNKPQISVVPSLVATEPQSVTLTCDVDAFPPATSLVWHRGAHALSVSDTDSAGARRYSGGTPDTPGLTIVRVSASDAGQYYCLASNPVGSTAGDTITLTVRYIPVITVSDSEVEGREGESVTLTVIVSSFPDLQDVEWRHLPLGDDPDAEVTVNVTSMSSGYSGGTLDSPSLTLVNVSAHDAGNYTLLVANSLGTRQASITLLVSYTPSTPIVTEGSGSYKEGESITLICNSTAYPLPEFRWYQGTELKGTGPVLNLGFASPGDAGQYKCEVFNPVGSDHISVTVVVFYKPRAGSISNVTATVGQTVTLTCDTDAHPPPNSYTWTKAGVTKSGSSSSNTLTVTVEDSGDFGRYDCVASNQEGTSDPIAVFILEDGTTGQSTESTGLSTATLILIIIICLILVVILIIIFCYCITKRCECRKKDNNVAPNESPSVPPPAVPESGKPLPVLHASANGTISARSAPLSHSLNGTRTTPRVDMEDEKLKPTLRNGTATLGHGMSISLPGGQSPPKPHHLPPLGQDGTSEETESARDDKPKKRRRRRRPHNDDNSETGNLQV